MLGRQLTFFLPSLGFAALAAGMPELSGGHGAHVLDDRRDPRQALDLAVIVDAGTARAGPAVWHDCQLFGEYEAEPTGRARPHQHDVEIAHPPVDGSVHGHG